jgi:hypothetical protein
LVVNGSRFVVTAPPAVTRWPSTPYLYLGAYLSNSTSITTFGNGIAGQGLSLSSVDTALPASSQVFADTFDDAVDDPTNYGLNGDLRARQPSNVSSPYTRTSGLPNTSTPPQAWYSQVNHMGYPNKLSFHLGTSAVRLNKPVVASVLNGSYAVHVVTDPVVGDTGSLDWASLDLSGSATTDGWPVAAGTDVGLTLRSNGSLQVFAHGVATWASEKVVAPAADGTFDLTVTASGARDLSIVVNGVRFDVVLTSDLPATAYLTLGAHSTVNTQVTTFDDLRVTKIGALSYYGYFDTMDPGDHLDHLSTVTGYTNMNQFLDSPATGYLDYCRPRSCMLLLQWQQFKADPSNSSRWIPRSDSAAQIDALKATVGSNLDKVGVVYMVDEPYTTGKIIQASDVQAAADQLVSFFPGIPIALTLDATSMPLATSVVPTSVDWVGFDEYCVSQATLTSTLNKLQSKLRSAYQQLYLAPESGPSQCADATDASIATKQDAYVAIANANPRVVYLMNFGWWRTVVPPDNDPIGTLPKTAARQSAIGRSVTGR